MVRLTKKLTTGFVFNERYVSRIKICLIENHYFSFSVASKLSL